MIKHATELIGKVPEVYSLARLPPDLGFEEVFKNMKVLMDEGLFGAFGASEMKRESLERAHKVSRVPGWIERLLLSLVWRELWSDKSLLGSTANTGIHFVHHTTHLLP